MFQCVSFLMTTVYQNMINLVYICLIFFVFCIGSSGPHSVDQRVEELVLELDQSDQKIKDQQVRCAL